MMKITNFIVETRSREYVKLDEIEALSFGMLVDERFKAETRELFVTCKQGHLRFCLEDIISISFDLEQETFFLRIESRHLKKEEEDGTI